MLHEEGSLINHYFRKEGLFGFFKNTYHGMRKKQLLIFPIRDLFALDKGRPYKCCMTIESLDKCLVQTCF